MQHRSSTFVGSCGTRTLVTTQILSQRQVKGLRVQGCSGHGASGAKLWALRFDDLFEVSAGKWTRRGMR